jgi:hypothetical protein
MQTHLPKKNRVFENFHQAFWYQDFTVHFSSTTPSAVLSCDLVD